MTEGLNPARDDWIKHLCLFVVKVGKESFFFEFLRNNGWVETKAGVELACSPTISFCMLPVGAGS